MFHRETTKYSQLFCCETTNERNRDRVLLGIGADRRVPCHRLFLYSLTLMLMWNQFVKKTLTTPKKKIYSSHVIDVHERANMSV